MYYFFFLYLSFKLFLVLTFINILSFFSFFEAFLSIFFYLLVKSKYAEALLIIFRKTFNKNSNIGNAKKIKNDKSEKS
jgi:hypothetical protein